MKKIILIFAALALLAGSRPAVLNDDGYKTVDAVATAADVLTLEDGENIKLYNDNTLIIKESYKVLIDTINDGEILNYWDLEVYELSSMK